MGRVHADDLVAFLGHLLVGADRGEADLLAGGTLDVIGDAFKTITLLRLAHAGTVVGVGQTVFHGRRLLLLGFLHTGRQLLVLGGLRPLHAVDGTVEATGSEAGTGLGFGFEWHVSGEERIA